MCFIFLYFKDLVLFYECFPAYASEHHGHASCTERPGQSIRSPQLELQTFMSNYVGSGI